MMRLYAIKLAFFITVLHAFIALTHLRAELYFTAYDARGATAIYPRDPEYHFMLALGNFTAQRYDRVLQSLNTTVELAPMHVDAVNNIGVVQALQFKDKEAEATFLRARRMVRWHPLIDDNLAILRGQKKGKFNMVVVQG